MNVRYLPEALVEYEAAAAWYDDHEDMAGEPRGRAGLLVAAVAMRKLR